LIHSHQTPDEIVAGGYDPQIVNMIVKLVTRAEFKRRQAPPGLKVTDRAFGTGWRMPISCLELPRHFALGLHSFGCDFASTDGLEPDASFIFTEATYRSLESQHSNGIPSQERQILSEFF
jgi:hypothetical protein